MVGREWCGALATGCGRRCCKFRAMRNQFAFAFVAAAMLTGCKKKSSDQGAGTPPVPSRDAARPEPADAAKTPEAPALPAGTIVVRVGFQTPESVLHDPSSDTYLVSNINGGPVDVDDNGF